MTLLLRLAVEEKLHLTAFAWPIRNTWLSRNLNEYYLEKYRQQKMEYFDKLAVLHVSIVGNIIVRTKRFNKKTTEHPHVQQSTVVYDLSNETSELFQMKCGRR